MRLIGLKAMLIGYGALWIAPPLSAQQRIAAETLPVVPARTADALLTRKITLDIRNLPMREAIDAVAANAKVLIQYRTRAVTAYTQPVTLQMKNASLRDVLEHILERTTLRVIPDGATQLMIVEARELGVAVASGVIVGRVTHAKTKRPVAGVTVLLDNARQGITVADDGTFRISASAGEHIVHVRGLGFVKQERRMTVLENGTVTLDVALEPSTSVLDEVVVTGTVVATERKAIATPITVITAEDIEKRGITRVEDLLRGEVPGVIVLDEGVARYNEGRMNGGQDTLGVMVSSPIYSRGNSSIGSALGQPTPLKVFMDGVELLDPSYLGTIDPSSIERIEIVTGPQAATIYGAGAMGGVMQIFTKTGTGTYSNDLTFRLLYSMLQNSFSDAYTPAHNHGASLNGGTGPALSYSGTLSYRYTGQWQPDKYSRSYGGSMGATTKRAPLSVAAAMSITGTSNGTNGRGNSNASSPRDWARRASGEYLVLNTAGYRSQRIAKSRSQTLSLNMDYAPRTFWQHHVTIGRTQTKLALMPEAPVFSTPIDTFYRATQSDGERTTAGYNISFLPARAGILSSTFTVGINGSWGDRTESGGCLASEIATSYVGCQSGVQGLRISRVVDDESYGGFSTMRIGLWNQLYVNFGLRGERNPAYGQAHKIDWTPTNGIAYTLELGDVSLKLLGSYGRATRSPTPIMRRSSLQDNQSYDPAVAPLVLEAPDLTPEYSRGPQGGIELYIGNHGSLSVNRFKQRVTDLIQRLQVDSSPRVLLENGAESYWRQFRYMNVASIRSHGWETTASINLGPVNLKGTHSWSDSRVESSRIANYRPGMTFQNLPTHSGNMTAGYARRGTSLMLVSNYIGARVNATSAVDGSSLQELHLRDQAYARQNASGRVAQRRFPGYTKMNFTMSQRIHSWATATLNVMNLANSFISDVNEAFPTLGRQTMLGMSMRFPRTR